MENKTSSVSKRTIQVSWIPGKDVDLDKDCDMCVLFANSPCTHSFNNVGEGDGAFENLKTCLDENRDLFRSRQEELSQKLKPFFDK